MFDYLRTFWLIIGIVIPALSVWVFFDARKRGKDDREAFWWAAGALFLVIFVVPVWLWTRPNFEVENEFLCPECKDVYRGRKLACPHCGYMLVEDEIVDLSGNELEEDIEDELPVDEQKDFGG